MGEILTKLLELEKLINGIPQSATNWAIIAEARQGLDQIQRAIETLKE